MRTPSSSGSSNDASSAEKSAPESSVSIAAKAPSPIQSRTPEELVAALGVSITSARKVVAAVHQRMDDVLGVRVPRLATRKDVDTIAAHHRVGKLEVVAREASKLDPFVKYVLACEDGARIETVRIPLEKSGRFVVCVSSQVGCAIGCAFCATGRMGLSRNLEAWEIVEQVRLVRRELPEGCGGSPEQPRRGSRRSPGERARVHGVVFQGMGEPLANVDRVIEAIRVLHHPCGGAIEQRAITVCTVGVPSGVRKLAKSGLRVRLGVSIASARAEVRKRLVPVERSNPLEEVLDAAAEFVDATGDAPMFAITALSGVNTDEDEARAFAEMIAKFRARTGVAPRVSIVPYNPIDAPADDPFRRPAAEEFSAMRARLSAIGVPVVVRYSGGADVGAACGQLVARVTS